MSHYFKRFKDTIFIGAVFVAALVSCGPVGQSPIKVQAPLPTPTPEPTFTPSPLSTSSPQFLPTTTTQPESVSTPAPVKVTLSGQILDQDTSQPIADAQVSVGTASTTTDADGRYTLTDLPPGQYVLSVTHPDYDPGLSSIFTVSAGEEPIVDVPLYEPDTSPYPKDPMLTNPLDPNGAPTPEDAERLARLQDLSGEVVSIRETKLRGEFLVNYKIGDDIRAAVAELNHEVWELTDETGRQWWIIKVCGNLASPLPAQKPIPTPNKPISRLMAEVVVDELSVRACTSEECAEVGTVPLGERVEIFGCLADNSWCEVGWSGGRGWCTGRSLRQLAVATVVPVVEEILPTTIPSDVTAEIGKIAFVSQRDDPDPQNCFKYGRSCNYEIYVMNADGSGLTRLTNHPAYDSSPAWSPDGTHIVFYSKRDDNDDIYVMNADGSNVTRLTNNPATDWSPTWLPNGQQIGFNSYRDGNGEIYVMNIDGSNLKRLTNHPADDSNPDWSSDGQKITFASNRDDSDPQNCGTNGHNSCNYEIYVMNVDGSGVTRLTNHPDNDNNPVWSPNGSKIAFTRNLNIYIVNADGSGLTRLTDRPANDWMPAWSPDGSKFVFQSVLRAPNDSHDIYVMNSDGSGVLRLTSHPAWDGAPVWSR